MGDLFWTRWVKAASALTWVTLSAWWAWEATASWWAFAGLALVFAGLGLVLFLVLRLGAGLLYTVLVWPFVYLFERQTKHVHGSARFQTGREQRRGNLSRGGRIYLGQWLDWRGRPRTLTAPAGEHVLVVGSSRSGKGTGIVTPTLLDWRESVIAYDEKGELSTLTANWRSREAHNEIFLFEPANPDSECAFNFLSAVRLGSEFEVADVQNIASVLVDDEVSHSGDEAHWQATARELVAGVILHCLYREAASLASVAFALSNPQQPPDELFAEMAASSTGFVASVGASQAARADRERSAVTSTALRYLGIFRDPIVAQNTSESTFSWQDLADGESPASLYIITRSVDAHRLRPLVKLLFTQAMLSLMGADLRFDEAGRALPAHRYRVLMVLDEFAALGKMAILEQSLARCLGYGVSALIVTQDISQLTRSYGEHQNVSNNCNIRVAFPPNEYATAVWVSNQLGKTTVEYQTRSRHRPLLFGGKSRSETTGSQLVGRELLMADEILALPKPSRGPDGEITAPGKLIILESGKRAIKADQLLYWRDAEMARRSRVTADDEPTSANVVPFPAGQGSVPLAAKAAAILLAIVLPAAGLAASLWPASPPLRVSAVNTTAVPSGSLPIPDFAKQAGAVADGAVATVTGAAASVPAAFGGPAAAVAPAPASGLSADDCQALIGNGQGNWPDVEKACANYTAPGSFSWASCRPIIASSTAAHIPVMPACARYVLAPAAGVLAPRANAGSFTPPGFLVPPPASTSPVPTFPKGVN